MNIYTTSPNTPARTNTTTHDIYTQRIDMVNTKEQQKPQLSKHPRLGSRIAYFPRKILGYLTPNNTNTISVSTPVFGMLVILAGAGLCLLAASVADSKERTIPQTASLGTFVSSDKDTVVPHLKTIMELPKTEPSVLVVDNATKLRAGQPFFNPVANGDVLVLYPQKAIIYRPATKKIVQVGPIVLEE